MYRTKSVMKKLGACSRASLLTYSAPIKASVHGLQLFLHLLDILLRPLRRVYASFNSSILSWEPKCIPCHGMKNIVTSHAIRSGEGIRNGIHSEMTHMKAARGIWKHWDDEKFRFRVLRVRSSSPRLLGGIGPSLSPFFIDGLVIEIGRGINRCPSNKQRIARVKTALCLYS